MTIAAALLVLSSVVLEAEATGSKVSNILPKRDTNGKILDAHDGNIVFDPATKLYYYYSVGYGDCEEPIGLTGCSGFVNPSSPCGFLNNHSVNLYSTADFTSWKYEGNVLPLAPPRPTCVLFSPKVIYNARSALWVLWANWVNCAHASYTYTVSTSPSPLGPFINDFNDTVAMSTQYGNLHNNSHVGDLNLFLDSDGKGYLIYSSQLHVQIEPLSEDFRSSAYNATGLTSGQFPTGNEAPAMFKRNGMYYALLSDACCFCNPGAGVFAYVASAPLGPYTLTWVNSPRGSFTWDLCPFAPLSTPVATCAQQTLVFQTQAGDTVWMGDRWQTAPPPARLKSQDFTSIFRLDFFPNGTITPLHWENETVFAL